jgi:hypothetical protein
MAPYLPKVHPDGVIHHMVVAPCSSGAVQLALLVVLFSGLLMYLLETLISLSMALIEKERCICRGLDNEIEHER